MKPKRDDFRTLVHNPTELAESCLAWAEEIQASDGVTWGVPAIDEKVIPLRPGEMAVIVGRPGHGKSSAMVYLALQEAHRIVKRGTQEQECVVYVTWEESAEELTKMLLPRMGTDYTITDLAWGRVPLDVIRRQVAKAAEFPPVWIIGHGMQRAKRGQRAPTMHPESILAAIETMEGDFEVRPTLLLFDYVQRIPIKRLSNKVEEVTEAVKQVGNLAMRIGAPCYVGAQARQEVDRRDDKMPTASDCQWASAILQDADKLFAVLRPVKYIVPSMINRETFGLQSAAGDEPYTITANLLILRMWKQRGDAGNYTWPLYFNPATLEMGLAAPANGAQNHWSDGDKEVPF